MITANFDTYNTYTTDSLYQWDINQTLNVSGLNLSVAPEVHFSNASMDKAIMRQATLKNRIVSVDIPNSVLQTALNVNAYIGIYENNTFKVIEKVIIPVKPKEKPYDYKLENTDNEIYSFNALKNAIAQKADNSVVNARIDTIIAHNNDTESNTELIDIRTDIGGAVHDSAGSAVRDQFSRVFSDIEKIKDVVKFNFQYLDFDKWIESEYWNGTAVSSSTGYSRYPVIKNISAGTYYWLNLSTNFTVIENVATGEITKLSAFDANPITVDYTFNLYATVSYAGIKSMFGTGVLPNEYLYGIYNISYENLTDEITDARISYDGTNYSSLKDRLDSENRVFYCGSTRSITKLKDAIETAEQYMDSVLYVDRGVYDLIEEYGSNYFTNYTSSDGVGIVLKNRIHIIFEQGAKVICNYNGDNENVHTYFSPFNAGEYGFTLENAYVESTNTRYSMHDERSGNPVPYKNIYKRCTFIHDSSNTSWGAHQALGGGLGCWGDILIEDCYLSAVECDDVLTYHNAGYQNPNLLEYASNIVIRGCYIEGGIRINSTGYSELITNAYVTNNSLTTEPSSGKTTEDAKTNIALHAWNNHIRS